MNPMKLRKSSNSSLKKKDDEIIDFYFDTSYSLDNFSFERRVKFVSYKNKQSGIDIMLTRLLVTIVISLLLIIVIHYLYTYFKETLTNPIEKQIIQQTQEKYDEIYKLSQPSQALQSQISKKRKEN